MASLINPKAIANATTFESVQYVVDKLISFPESKSGRRVIAVALYIAGVVAINLIFTSVVQTAFFVAAAFPVATPLVYAICAVAYIHLFKFTFAYGVCIMENLEKTYQANRSFIFIPSYYDIPGFNRLSSQF